MVGLGRFELPTSPLSGVRSNQLSYRPEFRMNQNLAQPACHQTFRNQVTCEGTLTERFRVFKGGDPAAGSPTATLLRLHPSHEPYRGQRSPEG